MPIWVMPTLSDHPEASRELARRLRLWAAVGFGQILLTIVACWVLIAVWPAAVPIVLVGSMLSYIPAYIFVTARLMAFRCPRCRGRWFGQIRLSPLPWGNTRCGGCRMFREPT